MPAEPAAPHSLDAHLRWMLHVVTHPDGDEAGVRAAGDAGLLPPGARTLHDVVTPGPQLDAAGRLHVYAYAYLARLVEVMGNEYPSIKFLLGDKRFESLCRRFLVGNPSRSYSLNRLSAGFPAWLAAESADFDSLRFPATLAAVERNLEEIWDIPHEEPASFDSLASIPMEAWPTARLQPIQAMRLLRLHYPVQSFLDAFRRDEHEPEPSPRPTWVLCYRSNWALRRRDLGEARGRLLERILAGAALGEALESAAAAAADAEFDALLADLRSCFETWFSEGLFVSVSTTGPSPGTALRVSA
jgi:hypothetical protein